MLDTAQIVLLFVVIVLTLLLLVLGIQVFFILRELRKTLHKANKVLDDTSTITESVSGPIASVSTIMSGVKAGALIAGILKKKKHFFRSITKDDGEE